jgi:hypothetical protein
MIPHMIRQGGGSIVNNSSTAGYGPGVIWRIDVADRGVIDAADLEPATPRMQEAGSDGAQGRVIARPLG